MQYSNTFIDQNYIIPYMDWYICIGGKIIVELILSMYPF